MLQRFFESIYQTGFGSEIVFQVQVGGPKVQFFRFIAEVYYF
jgi:hypothetical protein